MIKFNHEGTVVYGHFNDAVQNSFNIIKISDFRETHQVIRIEQIDVAELGLGQAEDLCDLYDKEAAFFETYTWVGGIPKSESDVIKILNNAKIIKAAA